MEDNYNEKTTTHTWRTIKYENVYLEEYESPRAARIGLSRYADYYNRERPHSGLAYETPEAVYLKG